MLSERLQILVTPEQRSQLESEAKRRGSSVGALIRDAIDARLGGVSREERIEAVEAIAQLEGGRFISPEELNRIFEQERDEELDRAHGPQWA